MNEIDPMDGGSETRFVVKRVVLVYGVVALAMLALRPFLHHLQPDFPLVLGGIQVSGVICQICLYATAKTRWIACGVFSAMTFAFSLGSIPLGLGAIDAIELAPILSLTGIAVIWGCTYLLGVKARQRRPI